MSNIIVEETNVVVETTEKPTEVVINDNSSTVVVPLPEGLPGVGLPAGGTAGQIATKQSDDDYDVVWGNAGGNPLWSDILGDQADINLSGFTNDSGFLTSFIETDPTVPTHVKSITSTQITNWDSAFSWGDHASENYLTSISGLPISSLNNDTGFITGYTVTQSDVTQHEGALSITESQISDLGNYSVVGHTHIISDVTGLQTELNSKLESSDIADFETTTQLNIRDTNNRNRVNHTGTQAINTVTNLQNELDSKAASSHTHTLSDITDSGTAASLNTGTTEGTIPVLQAGGKLSEGVLPSLALTEVFSVADDTARNALTVQEGDVAVVDSSAEAGDEPASYIYNGTSWVKLKTPTDKVSSVFGRSGAVVSENGDYAFSQISGEVQTSQIAAGSVTNSKLTNMPANTIRGRLTTTGTPQNLTVTQTRNLLSVETSTQLDDRDTVNKDRANHTGTQTASTISDFDTAIESNTEVSANTSARHTHANKALLDTYDQTNTDISGAISHVSDTNNPHGVTKTQVGLSNVTNDAQVALADKASTIEAETGTDDTKWMTPLKTKQAIDEFAGSSGESNTASNVGTGAGVFKEKVGVDLRLKTLVAGSNVTFNTTNPDEIQINSSSGGINNVVEDTTPQLGGALDALNNNINNVNNINFQGQATVAVPKSDFLRFGASGQHDTHVLVVGDNFGGGGRVNFRYGSAGCLWDSVTGSSTANRAIMNPAGLFSLFGTGLRIASGYFDLGGNQMTDTLLSTDSPSSSNSALVTAGYVNTAIPANSAVAANTAKVTNATHTGDVTGATALTIANNAVTTAKIINDAVTNAKLSNVATATIKGRATAGTGDPEDLSAAQVRALLNVADGSTANPNAIDNVVEDTTPQLGGNLDLNEKGFTKQITLGETVTAGQVIHLHTDGKYYLADAGVPADAVDELILALAGGDVDDVVAGLVFGYYTTSGLTAGSIYYLSETAGAITATAPTTSLSVVRILGYALSTTVLLFRPDTGYVELA